MTDISKTIAPKSDQLNADDLIGGPKTITVTKVLGTDSDEQPVSIYFEGDNGKPFKPGLSMRRVLVQVWGNEGDDYVGRSMTLYQDPEVKFGGIKVGGIRISHMSHISKEVLLMLTTTRARKGEFRVKPLILDTSERAIAEAEEAAAQGKDAFVAFYNSDFGKANRSTLKPQISRFQEIAAKADEANTPLSQRLAAPAEGPEFDEDSVDPMSEAYDEGFKASKAGDEGPNPYDPGTEEWNNWTGGYQFQQAHGKKDRYE